MISVVVFVLSLEPKCGCAFLDGGNGRDADQEFSRKRHRLARQIIRPAACVSARFNASFRQLREVMWQRGVDDEYKRSGAGL